MMKDRFMTAKKRINKEKTRFIFPPFSCLFSVLFFFLFVTVVSSLLVYHNDCFINVSDCRLLHK